MSETGPQVTEGQGERARSFIKETVFPRLYQLGGVPVEFINDEKIYARGLKDTKLFARALEGFERYRDKFNDVLPSNDYAPAEQCGMSVQDIVTRLIKILVKNSFEVDKWVAATYSHANFIEDVGKNPCAATAKMLNHLKDVKARQIEVVRTSVGPENFPYLLSADPVVFGEIANWNKKASEAFIDFCRVTDGVRINEFFLRTPEFRELALFKISPQVVQKIGPRIYDFGHETLAEIAILNTDKIPTVMDVLFKEFEDVRQMVPVVFNLPHIFRVPMFAGFIKSIVAEVKSESVSASFADTVRIRVQAKSGAVKEGIRKNYAAKTGGQAS
jgi:hypothetical protein